MPNLPSDGLELPDELAPDPELRAARNELRAVSASIREALAADERLVNSGRTAQ